LAEAKATQDAVARGELAQREEAFDGGTEKAVIMGVAPEFANVVMFGIIAETISRLPGVVLKSKVSVVPGARGAPTRLKLQDKMSCVSQSPPVAPVKPT
jgi:hypothetical protein